MAHPVTLVHVIAVDIVVQLLVVVHLWMDNNNITIIELTNDVCMWTCVCVALLERLMSLSPKSQVMSRLHSH